jgi:outer membrane protein assembly factor BamE (lipoprotein component of BamABCDE complex)
VSAMPTQSGDALMSAGRTIAFALLLAVVLGGAGCLVSTDNHVKREGTYISESTFKEIEPGKTTSAWVLAALGTPTDKTMVEPGHEMWKYTYKETKDSHGHVFLLFSGSDHKIKDGSVFVELKDGVVTKCWRA